MLAYMTLISSDAESLCGIEEVYDDDDDVLERRYGYNFYSGAFVCICPNYWFACSSFCHTLSLSDLKRNPLKP